MDDALTSFSVLYRRYRSDVYRYALALSGSSADAEDLLSETFLRVWASGTAIRSATVRAYLLTICRNLFLEGRRRRKEDLLEGDPTDSRDLAREHEARDAWESLRPLLAELPETTRSALIMHSLLGMPYRDIEPVLGVSATALHVRVHRARIFLAERMGMKGKYGTAGNRHQGSLRAGARGDRE